MSTSDFHTKSLKRFNFYFVFTKNGFVFADQIM